MYTGFLKKKCDVFNPLPLSFLVSGSPFELVTSNTWSIFFLLVQEDALGSSSTLPAPDLVPLMGSGT